MISSSELGQIVEGIGFKTSFFSLSKNQNIAIFHIGIWLHLFETEQDLKSVIQIK